MTNMTRNENLLNWNRDSEVTPVVDLLKNNHYLNIS